jgi:hypothetical protein
VYQSIFDQIVSQAMGHGLVGGRVLYTDSTHLKANTNKNRLEVIQLERAPSAYLTELDAAVDADRVQHGKRPLKRDPDEKQPTVAENKLSRTDPDSGYMMGYRRPNHKPGTYYKREYHYHAQADTYACPQGQTLSYATTNRQGYRQYKSDPTQRRHCLVLSQCTRSANATKIVTRQMPRSARMPAV